MLALFDSGMGGLSVLREVRKVYKGPLLYLGDTARAPYGNRSQKEIREYTKQLLLFAQSKGATHFVSACNSISTLITRELLEEVALSENNCIDMVLATKEFRDKKYASPFLVIATKATIESASYREVFADIDEYSEIALPLLAGAIEVGDIEQIRKALIPLDIQAFSRVKTVFLGCTHYPFALSFIQERFPEASSIDPAQFVREACKKFTINEKEGVLQVIISAESEIFRKTLESVVDGEYYEFSIDYFSL